MSENDKREMLRHVVATIAYRGGKTLRDAPAGFAEFSAGSNSRTPLQILSHISDLFDWASSMLQGKQVWRDNVPVSWDEEVARFHQTLAALDENLSADAPLEAAAERLFQGPLADALTHIGQLAMLRRMVNAPIRGENYFLADIEAGSVGVQQSAPRKEFE